MASIDRVKVSVPVWDSDKDPGGYRKWATVVAGMVRSCKGGLELESFKEQKMGVPQSAAKIVPSFLSNDPDFNETHDEPKARKSPGFDLGTPGEVRIDIDKKIESQPDNSEGHGEERTPRRVITPGSSKDESYFQAATSYARLSTDAKTLDCHIYSVMVMNVKGAKAQLLSHVISSSYVQASIILSKHDEISRNSRKSEALENMVTLKLNDSVQTWAMEAVMFFQELKDSKVTIEDWALMCVIKSLEGKSKYVQHEIVKDINMSEDGVDVPFFDLIQRYASAIASVEGNNQKPVKRVDGVGNELDENGKFVGSLADIICHNCKKKGHLARNCPEKTPENPDNGDIKRFTYKCSKCGKAGHKRKDCPDKGQTGDVDPKPSNAASESFSTEDVLKMMQQLRSGTVGSCMYNDEACESNGNVSEDVCDICFSQCDGSCSRSIVNCRCTNIFMCDNTHVVDANGHDVASSDSMVDTLTQNMGQDGNMETRVLARDGCQGCVCTEVQGLTTVSTNMSLVHNQQMGLDGTSMPKSLGIADTMPLVCRYHGQVYKTHDSDQMESMTDILGVCRDHGPVVAVDNDGVMENTNTQELSSDEDEMLVSINNEDGNTVDDEYLLCAQLMAKAADLVVPKYGIVNTIATDNVSDMVSDGLWVSLCGGMDTLALVAKELSIAPSRYVSVETATAARKVGQAANPKTDTFPGIDHGWANDVSLITKEMVVSLGPVSMLGMGAPCQDHSKCRLLPARFASDRKVVKRPGFNGDKGKVFKQGVQVIQWMLEVNPAMIFIVENVDFSDMKEDMAWIAAQLGVEPVLMDGGYTRRKRLFWTNLELPADIALCVPTLDPDQCMDTGRTLVRHNKGYVATICGSWTGDVNNPVANTRLPILVIDEKYSELQQLRVHEAELLMGMPKGCTSGNGITAIMRLRCIGNAWDVKTVSLIVCVYRMQRKLKPCIKMSLSKSDKLLQMSLIVMQSIMGEQELATVLSKYNKTDQVRFLLLLNQWHGQHPKIVNSCRGSILDSGSARHINNKVVVTNLDDAVPLKGFNGSVSWTSGSGTMPIVLQDQVSGNKVTMHVDNVDKVDSNSEPILSLGKLLRLGVDFHFTDFGKTCEAITADGNMRFAVTLSEDDVLRINHDVTTTGGVVGDTVNLVAECNKVTRQLDNATPIILHNLFNHGSDEIVYQTLLHTHGYEAKRWKPFHCSACAQANARKRGISHKNVNQVEGGLKDTDYEDSDSQNSSDDDDMDQRSIINKTFAESFDNADLLNGGEIKTTVSRVPEKHKPRFDVKQMKPCEVMMADNKSFPCNIRGDYKQAFLLIDVRTQRKYVVKLKRKATNHEALLEILTVCGAHKLPYLCTLYTDGCGSMKPVREIAIRMGLNHMFVPPHTQSLNDSEKVVDRVFASARTHMIQSNAPLELFGDCVEYVCYTDAYMATNALRGHLTPIELESDQTPSIHHLIPWYTKCVVVAPKEKCKLRGDILSRGEEGRFLGYQAVNSKVYKVMLNGNRLVHAIRGNVSFDFSDAVHPKDDVTNQPEEAHKPDSEFEMGFKSEEALQLESAEEANPTVANEEYEKYMPGLIWTNEQENEFDSRSDDDVESLKSHFSNGGSNGSPEWKTHGASTDVLQDRPRPQYVVNLLMNDEVLDHVKDAKLAAILKEIGDDHGMVMDIAGQLAFNVSEKDMGWKKVLNGPDRELAIAAYNKEVESLISTILTPIFEDDPKYENAVKEATSGRFLLDVKRCGTYKARGVKQGFKENLEMSDGPDFNYYAHVAEMKAIRAALLRPNRRTRKLATIDVCTAFLQSIPYPDGKRKLIKFKCPIVGKWLYYEQSGPIYGENSAPVYWGEQTLAPFLISCGFVRGENHKCTYYHPEHDLVVLTYVDDILMDGEEKDILWFEKLLEARFKCKPSEWLSEGNVIDFVGIQVFMVNDCIYLSMEKYIEKMVIELRALGMVIPNTKCASPMTTMIEDGSEPLTTKQHRLFLTALGCEAWLSHTTRLDVSHAFSRTGQHTAKPTVNALKSLSHQIGYIEQHKDLCIFARLYSDNESLNDTSVGSQLGWEFYTDSDHAGNTEEQNKRRSQNGAVCMVDGSAVDWMSKASSVGFALPLIGEAHAEVSTGGVEIYATANATYEILDMSYLIEEQGRKFPFPFELMMDNTTAEAFCNQTVKRSKLKHIDCRQEWVKCIRDKNIMIAKHVDTKENLADLFTKILDSKTFILLRDQMMIPFSVHNV